MLGSDFAAIVMAVKEQYESFPFPPITIIEEEDPHRDLRASFNLEFGLGRDRALKQGSKIWVPGCGTRWAVMTALQFRDAQVVASDLSDKSLSIQAELARSLNIDNIDFRSENLLETRYESEFDFISCVGVLHHLPDPERGFRIMGRALKPSGLAEIMVYDRWNRQYSIRMRSILDTFDPGRRLNATERFELALRLLRSANHHASTPPQLKPLLKHLSAMPSFAQTMADIISHPQEHHYDVPSLVASLRAGGLAPRCWKVPYLFDPKAIVSDQTLWAIIDRMTSERRAELGQLLSAGQLEVFAEHPQPTVHSHNAGAEVRNRRVRSISKGLRHHIDSQGRVIRTEEVSKLVRTEAGIAFDGGGRRPAVVSYSRGLDCIREDDRLLHQLTDLGFVTALNDDHVQRIEELAKRPASLGEIARIIAQQDALGEVSEDAVLDLCDHLCRTPFRILATV